MAKRQHKKEGVNNPDFLKELVQRFMQEYLEQEMVSHIGALPYERTTARNGQRNGYKSRQLNTRVGKLFLSVPQARDGSFSTELFERYQRSERALLNCLQEMVIQGVSTRKVKKVTEELCGLNFSKSQVSEISKGLDQEIQTWLNRPLKDKYPYVYVDARYEKVRRDHSVESNAVLIALGVNQYGKRDILGMDVCNGENETNWGDFFHGLKDRGLHGTRLLVSDAHDGLVKALTSTFPGAEWQRCQVHFRKNVLDKVRVKDKAAIKNRLNDVLGAPNKTVGLERLSQLVADLSETYPQVADMLEMSGEDAIACLNYPAAHRKRLSSTNGLERFNEELRRRTRVIRIFPNHNSAMRMVGALCMEQAEEWMTGKMYLNMDLLNESEENQEETPENILETVEN
jgi:transposase-like protein